MDVKNALRDWRLPAIFAVPILLWAGLLYLVLQPLPGSGASAVGGTVTITMSPIASPWHQVNATYPAYVWPTPKPTVPCAHTTVDPKAITEYGPNGTFKNIPALVCAP